MGRPVFVPPKWRKPAPLGYPNAIDSVGTVASPLLAGFSLASVIIVSDDAANFRWPGAVILALVIAAVLLVGTVQCSFNARQYIWSAADVVAWWPDMEEDSPREARLRSEQDRAFRRWEAWSTWTRLAYNSGIPALLVALALAIAPQHATEAQASLHWVACGVAFTAGIGEAAWVIVSSLRHSRGPKSGND